MDNLEGIFHSVAFNLKKILNNKCELLKYKIESLEEENEILKRKILCMEKDSKEKSVNLNFMQRGTLFVTKNIIDEEHDSLNLAFIIEKDQE